jgi:hypothetical protein
MLFYPRSLGINVSPVHTGIPNLNSIIQFTFSLEMAIFNPQSLECQKLGHGPQGLQNSQGIRRIGWT